MQNRRILLLHISSISGHRAASLAIEKALHELDASVQTRCLDTVNYTNPYLEKFINLLYMFVIKFIPRFWDFLYDNEDVLRRAKKIRSLIHRLNDKKIARLFDEFKPDVVICTQAFPCGMVADYKRRRNLNLPLIAVLTDYAPHLYWLTEFVDIYVVPTFKAQQKFVQRGIPQNRIAILGIPIDSKFRYPSNRAEIFHRLEFDLSLPVILIMGGGQGLGPIKKIVRTLDKLSHPVQLVVVCGTNKSLYRWLEKNKTSFQKPLRILGYTKQINDLMTIASFIVTKPGGITSAEALSKSLPMVIVKPLPGQENLNTRFLLEANVALKANSLSELFTLAEELISDTTKLEKMRKDACAISCADSALKIAQFTLEMIKQAV